MSADIGLFEAMNTQRAIRYLKPDPVPEEMIAKLIEAATRAPSGTNQQGWSFIVVRDAGLRSKLGDIYQKAGRAAIPRIRYVEAVNKRLFDSAVYLVDHLGEAPVLILPCIEHSGPTGLTTGASIYPAVQNILLAARALGLGSVLTTFHKAYEGEVKELLGLPENVETAALLPVGFPADGVRYGPTNRQPVDQVLHWDRW
ncbi:MAG: nitroreductase family protein [Chloroflexi bacterium]|nr:nitroreductase family protein [Chloroflexota bacterium]MCH8868093.1 nitroreductase family protein [Chloroflexota bacterium]MCH9040248.1 nitroreductase family protein [Chloroflexota bacterium]MCI0791778.1 nitroreductase family protein [Chloroflexota bacterium]MCI0796389.1 nitroreductase family protein [Chloroflexota bacterium]